ncbi:MAG: hypothetical protein KIS78_10645 [Labilithrix sp.]|nr:hypothetical protein [Labilithrix sp.]MCW5832858.1 hypothetical protein [Labilithrix sp.]
MADPPSPNQSRPGFERGSSSGELGYGPASSRASVPPSEPRSSRASFEALDAQIDRPARLQMIVALILGLVLVAIPLYLWRRPRAESIAVNTGASDAGALPAVTAATTQGIDEKLVVGEPRIVSCHDPGPKKTPPERCDHVAELEAAFAKAIEDAASCVPREAGGGTIIFVADANFKKRSVAVSTPKEGRTLRSSKVAGACERAVKSKLAGLPYESMKHEHARYRVSITATYPSAPKP